MAGAAAKQPAFPQTEHPPIPWMPSGNGLEIIYNPPALAAPVGHFERAVRLGDWLFVSGTSALTNVSGSLSDRHLVQGVEAQAHETLDNLEEVLRTAGGSWDSVYEMRITLADRKDFPAVDGILRERIPQKGFICHAYQGILLHPEMDLEIEINAYLGSLGSGRAGRN
jgi:enamine deaminase RidA (YjgF/YER057c/UK114 family)